MEESRNFKAKLWLLLGIFFIALAFSAAMPGAEAGTILTSPEPPEKLRAGENYPESRFGQAPARLSASRAVVEMESSDEEDPTTGTHGGRSPAGLVFNGEQAPVPSRMTPSMESVRAPEPASVAARNGVQEVALIASDLGFFPKTVFVSRDVPVRLFVTGSSKNALCIMMDSFQVRKQVRSQKVEEITFTPNVPGKYRFYCPLNGMEGTMIVKELASSVPEQDSAATGQAAPIRRMPASPTEIGNPGSEL